MGQLGGELCLVIQSEMSRQALSSKSYKGQFCKVKCLTYSLFMLFLCGRVTCNGG